MKRTKKYHTIWTLLNDAGHLSQDYELWATWCKCVASAIYLEDMFWDAVQEAKKPVYKNLEGKHLWTSYGRAECLEWCSKTYDQRHDLRFAVETLDSIEEVRVFLKKKSAEVGYHVHLHNLLTMTSPTFTFKEI